MYLDINKNIKNIESMILKNKNIKFKSQLLIACSENNLKYLNELIKNNVLVNTKENNFSIFYTCYYKNYKMAKLLIENNVNLNIKDYYNNTPLMYACILDDLKLAKLILKNLKNIDIDDPLINKSLFYACLNNNFELIKKIIENGYFNKKSIFYILVIYELLDEKNKQLIYEKIIN